jgi:hypothetical protein
MLDNGHCRRDHDARAADPCDELGLAHSVLDTQIAGAASVRNEPAAPAAIVKIGCGPDQGPAGNSPPFGRRSTVLDNRHARCRPHVRATTHARLTPLGTLDAQPVEGRQQSSVPRGAVMCAAARPFTSMPGSPSVKGVPDGD